MSIFDKKITKMNGEFSFIVLKESIICACLQMIEFYITRQM